LTINILGFFSTHICTIYVLLAHYVVSFKKIKVFLSATFPTPYKPLKPYQKNAKKIRTKTCKSHTPV